MSNSNAYPRPTQLSRPRRAALPPPHRRHPRGTPLPIPALRSSAVPPPLRPSAVPPPLPTPIAAAPPELIAESDSDLIPVFVAEPEPELSAAPAPEPETLDDPQPETLDERPAVLAPATLVIPEHVECEGSTPRPQPTPAQRSTVHPRLITRNDDTEPTPRLEAEALSEDRKPAAEPSSVEQTAPYPRMDTNSVVQDWFDEVDASPARANGTSAYARVPWQQQRKSWLLGAAIGCTLTVLALVFTVVLSRAVATDSSEPTATKPTATKPTTNKAATNKAATNKATPAHRAPTKAAALAHKRPAAPRVQALPPAADPQPIVTPLPPRTRSR